MILVVAVSKLRPGLYASSASRIRSTGPLHFIHRSFSTRKVARQYPVLAGLHKIADGALVGVLVAVALMSAFSLHWRHLWTVAYLQLESTRELSHELVESTALLERHILQRTNLPSYMVRTKVSNLLYLDRDVDFLNLRDKNNSKLKSILSTFTSNHISNGY